MLLTVEEFKERVQYSLPALIEELAELTGRGGESERLAWQRSLPRLADALASASLAKVHVHFERRQHHVSLEYQLPGVASTCDVVLLGRTDDRMSVVVIELKHWETSSDRPGKATGLIERHGIQDLHPSDQVRGYVEYCRSFHSAVIDSQAEVHGLVLFTLGMLKHPYVVEPNKKLTDEFPIFTMASEDVESKLPSYLASRLTQCDEDFAVAFALGTYRQNRSFMSLIGRTILDGDTRHFELLDNQRRAFNLTLATTHEAIADATVSRRVIVVEGPPGSGKSAVAARLWASLVVDESVPKGNVLVVTTSKSQNSNWAHLIDRSSGRRNGRGIARKATSFSPIDPRRLNQLRLKAGNKKLYKDAKRWRDHLGDLDRSGIAAGPGAESESVLLSLVDEAHALINPEREHGVGQYGFATGLGPQAYHIMRCSRVTVFFLDPKQSFRVRENTHVSDIEQWAQELGATVERVSLQGAQFRCAGSAEYVAWVESLLGGASEQLNTVFSSAWYSDVRAHARAEGAYGNVIAFPGGRAEEGVRKEWLRVAKPTVPYGKRPRRLPCATMDFRVYADPFQMEQELRMLSADHVVRLVSTYSRPWKTKGSSYPHTLPPEALDFSEVVTSAAGERRVWSRPWNFVPKGDYTGVVAGRIGLPIHDDPLCEVGCTYAIRGFDFDYIGLLWLDDLLWREGKWIVPLDNVHETGVSLLVRQARSEGAVAPAGPKGVNVLEKVRQAYRILLTRAIRGVFVWIPDEQTRSHVVRSLSENW